MGRWFDPSSGSHRLRLCSQAIHPAALHGNDAADCDRNLLRRPTLDVTSQVSWKSSAKKMVVKTGLVSRDQDRRSRDGDGQQGPQGPERFGHRYVN